MCSPSSPGIISSFSSNGASNNEEGGDIVPRREKLKEGNRQSSEEEKKLEGEGEIYSSNTARRKEWGLVVAASAAWEIEAAAEDKGETKGQRYQTG